MKTLTKAQSRVMTLIRKSVESSGHAPTIRAMAAKLKVAPNAIMCRLKLIEKKGYISRRDGVIRVALPPMTP